MTIIPQKQCSACQQWKPATLEYFYANQQGRYGLYARCITCFRIRQRPSEKPSVPDGSKQCTQCERILPSTTEYFYKQTAKTQDGLAFACKECISSKDVRKIPDGQRRCISCKEIYPATTIFISYRCPTCVALYEQHLKRNTPEEIPNGYKKCHKCRETKPATESFFYRHKSMGRKQGKLMSPCRSCCEAKERGIVEHRKQLSHLHYETHPEQYIVKWRNRNARKKQIKGKHTAKQIREQYERQHGECYYCHHKVIWGEHHVDHTFPISRVAGSDILANDISYLVITCDTCNRKKGNKFPWEWPEGGRLL